MWVNDWDDEGVQLILYAIVHIKWGTQFKYSQSRPNYPINLFMPLHNSQFPLFQWNYDLDILPSIKDGIIPLR